MNATATNNNQVTTLDFDLISNNSSQRASRRSPRIIKHINAEQELTRLIRQEHRGNTLLNFCTELSSMLIRNYLSADNAEALRNDICADLVETLACTEQQAHCLIDLSLELIHVKVHKAYRHANVNLDYQISMAAQALSCEAAAVG